MFRQTLEQLRHDIDAISATQMEMQERFENIQVEMNTQSPNHSIVREEERNPMDEYLSSSSNSDGGIAEEGNLMDEHLSSSSSSSISLYHGPKGLPPLTASQETQTQTQPSEPTASTSQEVKCNLYINNS